MAPWVVDLGVNLAVAAAAFVVGWFASSIEHRQQMRGHRTTHQLLLSILQQLPELEKALTAKGAIEPTYNPAGELVDVKVLRAVGCAALPIVTAQGIGTVKPREPD
jgi:hypothetical protein